MKSRRDLWLVAFVAVLFAPVILYVAVGGREQTSVLSRLISVTGIQVAGLMVYTMAIATRFRSKKQGFGIPFHRYAGMVTILLLLVHVILALMVDPDNIWILTMINSTARGAAGMAALTCVGLALLLGIFRIKLKLSNEQWKWIHSLLSWMAAIFALAHILWIDQLVEKPLWTVLFASIVCAAFFMWFTRSKGVNTTVIPGIARWTFVLAAILAVTVTIITWRTPETFTVGYVQSPLGPVGPSDRDMLYKVKQAGLWEMPVGEQAVGRARNSQYKLVAAKMAEEHHQLDALVTDTAKQLGITLPSTPTPDQQKWMTQITNSPGLNYDFTAVQLLRAAHARVLPVIAQVRAMTRNQAIRDFADQAMTYVNRHIVYLDSTNLVNYSALPEAPPPSPYQQPVQASFLDSRDIRTVVVSAIVVGVVGVLVTMLTISLLKGRRTIKSKPKHRKSKR